MPLHARSAHSRSDANCHHAEMVLMMLMAMFGIGANNVGNDGGNIF
jgi:hypothetical protein